MNIKIANGSERVVNVGDMVRLKDGRELEVHSFAEFGRLRLTDADGRFVLSRPQDIKEVMQKIEAAIEEVTQAVEKAQTFWAWFKGTTIGGLILSRFKKK